ncbi:MAG: hypothetical protein JSS42_09190 [Proteobacteria bacterium]|uniref:hypothetical protein n=1 Tax=Rudaea sp. TaxID=2136325 RepID=UPI00322043DB|nr:hypothetical protein [Pseudomonadota bacterium]
MRREEWQFEYLAGKLAEAAAAKLEYHQARIDWWKAKRTEIVDEIRTQGLDFEEKLVMNAGVSPKGRDWNNAATVSIRDDLRDGLEESQRKLAAHTNLLRDYSGWHQALSANVDVPLRLDINDWLFFFGKP